MNARLQGIALFLTATLLFAIGTTVLITVLAIPLAVQLNKVFFGRNLVRSVWFFPAIPSMAILGLVWRYILSPQILVNLNRMKQGAGGEVQLTDAIAEEVDSKAGVHGFRFRGLRYDCGSKAGFLQATVAFGLSRPDLRDEFQSYLTDMFAQQRAAQ